MAKDGIIELVGVVTDVLPNAMFRVQLKDDGGLINKSLLCHISGKIRQNKINILQGDEVLVEVSVYDTSKGRITYRRK
jgi:translation initiation factor IF-1